jgi:hypothetical protein
MISDKCSVNFLCGEKSFTSIEMPYIIDKHLLVHRYIWI